MLGDDVRDTFSFDGKNYRDTEKYAGNFINLPQRQRKRNYDLSATRETSGMKAHAADAAAKKKRKGPALHDFQLFDMGKLNAILSKERALAVKKEQVVKVISDLRAKASEAPAFGTGVAPGRSREELLKSADQMEGQLPQLRLSDAEEDERAKLLTEGFPDWSKKDFKAFCSSVERHGRYDFASISQEVMNETGKDLADIQRYFVSFWTNYQRIAEWEKVLERIERGEKKILRMRQIRDAIQEKVERHLEDTYGDYFSDPNRTTVSSAAELLHYSWQKMKLNYGPGARGKGYQEEEDAFLVCMMYRHGYGAAERIRMEIRRAWQFRFDWYFKSRSALEIQKRCDMVIKVIERENEEIRKKEEEERTGKQPEDAVDALAAEATMTETATDPPPPPPAAAAAITSNVSL